MISGTIKLTSVRNRVSCEHTHGIFCSWVHQADTPNVFPRGAYLAHKRQLELEQRRMEGRQLMSRRFVRQEEVLQPELQRQQTAIRSKAHTAHEGQLTIPSNNTRKSNWQGANARVRGHERLRTTQGSHGTQYKVHSTELVPDSTWGARVRLKDTPGGKGPHTVCEGTAASP